MNEITDKHFKTTVINMLEYIMENMGIVRREM